MPRCARSLALAPWVEGPDPAPAIYHCLSRVVNREFVLGRTEKEQFVRLMRRYERFCGVRILTYCVMSNHFHLLVEVPPRPPEGLSDEEFYERLAVLYADGEVAEVRTNLERFREAGNESGAEALMERYLYRMWDLSEFMKSLKQCFSRWFNKRHERRGTLWEERFKCVLVEDGYAARVMAAYIDLNPVRAGMVRKPEDYRWCGYSAAVSGQSEARAGISRAMAEYRKLGGGRRQLPGWRRLIREYRMILFSDGEVRYRENPSTGRRELARRGLSPEETRKVLERGGKLSVDEMLRCRVRALCDGAVIGSRKFVDEFFAAKRELFGPTRKDGARPIYGCETTLCSLRALRTDALG